MHVSMYLWHEKLYEVKEARHKGYIAHDLYGILKMKKYRERSQW